MLRRLLRHRSAQIGLVVLFFLTMVAVFADVIAPRGYEDQIETAGVKRRDPPCVHILGCDPAKPELIFGVDGNKRDLFCLSYTSRCV